MTKMAAKAVSDFVVRYCFDIRHSCFVILSHCAIASKREMPEDRMFS